MRAVPFCNFFTAQDLNATHINGFLSDTTELLHYRSVYFIAALWKKCQSVITFMVLWVSVSLTICYMAPLTVQQTKNANFC